MLEIWLAVAVVLIVLEITLGFTIVLFFAGLAAFIVAALIFFDYISHEELPTQITVFFAATVVWAIVLWKPLKKALNKICNKATKAPLDLVGQHGVIAEYELKAGKEGMVKWSGTLVRAELDTSSSHHTLKEGAIVVITGVRDNIFIVKELESYSRSTVDKQE